MPDEQPEQQFDLIETCKEILLSLLEQKSPEQVQAALAAKGIPDDDAQHLINITVTSAQEVSPVIEQRISADQAVQNLIAHGMNRELAETMTAMIVSIMGERAAESVEASGGPQETISEDDMKIMMRLATAIDTDLKNGAAIEVVAEAISQIEGINDVADVGGKELEFVCNVKLARQASERARAGLPLPEAIKQCGLDGKPAYASVLALFFMKLDVASSQSGNN